MHSAGVKGSAMTVKENMIYKECPYCKREVKISKTRKKVGKKLVRTGKYIYYCSYIDCDWNSKEFTVQ